MMESIETSLDGKTWTSIKAYVSKYKTGFRLRGVGSSNLLFEELFWKEVPIYTRLRNRERTFYVTSLSPITLLPPSKSL